MLAELMNKTLRAFRRQGDRRGLRLAKGRDSATEQFKDNPNDFCLNHSVNRAQQKKLRLSLQSELLRARLGVLLGREGKDGELRMQHVHNVQDALDHRIGHRRHHRHTVIW